MNEKKEYLSEEETQRISKKLSLIGKLLMIFGGISFLVCSVLVFGDFLDFSTRGLVGFLWVFSFGAFGVGLVLFFNGNQRKIQAYMMQQQMPLVQEGAEKMAPTAGNVAKEITKGIKEGLKEDEEK